MVPHLATALTGPVNELEQHLLDSAPAIERWFRLEWMEHTPAFYSSVLVHNAGYKLGPTVTNLFPDCWHLLSADLTPLAVQAAMAAIEKICPEARNLLIIPDNRMDDPHYLASLERLQQILHLVGLNIRFASLEPLLLQARPVVCPSGQTFLLEPLERNDLRAGLKNFDPCTILLNTPLDSGIPGILEDLHEQFLLPPLQAGWSIRRKSNHARCYQDLAKNFGKFLGIDHWLITPLASQCTGLVLEKPAALNSLASCVDALLAKIRRKYKEYGITEKPYVTIHTDSGITLQEVAHVYDAQETANALRASGLSQKEAVDLFVQEGIPTSERINNTTATPVIYTIDRYVIGGYYRLFDLAPDAVLLDNKESASLIPLHFDAAAQLPPPSASNKKARPNPPNRFYMYGVIARLAMLAASYEMEATGEQIEDDA